MMLFKWGLASPNSFWKHDDEILIGPKQRNIECSCIWALHNRFSSLHIVNIGRNQYIPPKNFDSQWESGMDLQ